MVDAVTGPERARDVASRPELRINVIGTLAASSLALFAYLLALVLDLDLPANLSVVLLTVAPVTAIAATVLLAVRARAEQDEPLRGVTTGLAVACVGMLLQLAAYRTLSPGGGVFATTRSGSALLYVFWHLALIGGVFAATVGRPRTVRRRVGAAIGLVIALLIATLTPESWNLVDVSGDYSNELTAGMALTALLILLVIARWVRLHGYARPPPAAGSRSCWC